MKAQMSQSSDTLNERFLLACENADVKLARKMRAEGAELDSVNDAGETAVHLAVKSGDRKMVEFVLTELHLNANARDAFGRTPLHWAAQQGNALIVETLLLAHADIEAKDDMGVEPKIYAEMAGHRDLVKIFNLVRTSRK